MLRRGIASVFGAGTVLFGAPLLLIAAWEEPLVAVAAMALIGVGNTLADVSSSTLLQRAVDDAVLARVFAVLESLAIGTIAIGGLLAPVAVDVLGERGALIVAGALLPLVVLCTLVPLRALDAAAGPPVQVARPAPRAADLRPAVAAGAGAAGVRRRARGAPGRGDLRAGRPGRPLLRDRRRHASP